jgi:uncharacterized RDD family membrane protein YckC
LVAIAATGEKVGFFPRFIAFIIDAVILGIIQFVVGLVLGAMGDAGATLAGILSFVISVGYILYFWSTTGQTIGHKVMNLRVVKTDGSALSIGTAVMRLVGFIVAEIPFFLGLLWVLWDANKQGWHDKIAGTYVVKA